MMHEGKRLQEKIDLLKRDLERPITPEKRRQIQEAINHLRRQKENWERPH